MQTMDNIKNVILDLGGVLFDLSYETTQEEFSKLGLSNVFSKAAQGFIFDQIEEGKISREDFLAEINKQANQNHSDKTIIDAWNIMLLGLPKERLELLSTLGSKYRLFLFSNTNEIHIEEVYNMIQKEHGIKNLDKFFEKVYLSNELGIRKPKKEGFLHIAKENNLALKETLFIDDSIQHVEGAKSAGLHSEWLDLSKENIHQMLKRLSII